MAAAPRIQAKPVRSSLLGALALALLGLAACGAPPATTQVPASSTASRSPGAPPPRSTASPEVPSAPLASRCPHGFGLAGSVDISPGAPAYFYDDRPSLGVTASGAAYVYLDHDTAQAFIARLDSGGAPKSVRPIVFPARGERDHVVAAAHGGAVAVASVVHHASQEADVELSLLDEQDRLTWTTRIDPSPLFDGSPAVAWGNDEIAVAFRRGNYPSYDHIELALLDPSTGKVRKTYALDAGRRPGVPSIAWDGASYWVAWDSEGRPRGISLARFDARGPAGSIRNLTSGVNPFLLPTPLGLAMAYDDQRAIWLALLDGNGATKLPPMRVALHPDPLGTPRKPVLAWDGGRFGLSYEVHFSASVFMARSPEAQVMVVEPDGKASPPLSLHADDDAGEMPAVLWTGKEWLAVYGRARFQQGKKAQVTAARLACLAQPRASAPEATGPCDARSRPAPEALRVNARQTMMSALPLEDGGWAALLAPQEPHEMRFVRTDREGKTGASAILSTSSTVRYPVLVRRPSGFAAAWIEGETVVEVALLDERGARLAGKQLKGDALHTMAPALAWTPKGLVVAYAHDRGVDTALLDASARVLRASSRQVSPPFEAGDCALGRGPQGLLLAFTTGTEMSETRVVRVARLDDGGKALGKEALATGEHAFFSDPHILGTPGGFLLLGSGPFSREVLAIELGPKGDVLRPERKLLGSYGYASMGGYLAGDEVRVFGMDGKEVQERRVCP